MHELQVPKDEMTEKEAYCILQFIAKKACSNGEFAKYYDSYGWHIGIRGTYKILAPAAHFGKTSYAKYNVYVSKPGSPFRGISLLQHLDLHSHVQPLCAEVLAKMIELSENGYDILFDENQTILQHGTTLEQILIQMELENLE